MGVRTGSRVNQNTTPPTPPTVKPKHIEIRDEQYHGKDPDQLAYPHVETILTADGSVELRAFTERAMDQLRSIARDQFLPTLRHLGLSCATLCEMPERNTSASGVCFRAGQASQDDPSIRQQIMLHLPDAAKSRVSYTTLHEIAHLREGSHDEDYRAEFGRILDWSVGRRTPFTGRRDDLLSYAKGDSYAPPTPVRATWDDYARPDEARGRTPVLKRALRVRPFSNVELTINPGEDTPETER